MPPRTPPHKSHSSRAARPGRRNLITDVPGIRVGNGADSALRSGVTVVLPDAPAIAAIDIRGGGPGTRESDVLDLGSTVQEIHGLVLSGGSAFGLNAAGGVQNWLATRGIGYKVGPADSPAIVPIVPQAILFDLLNGGDKNWGVDKDAGASPPYEALARDACDAANRDFDLGTKGAGFGATTANLKGGLGSASLITEDGFTLGALVAVNAIGQVTIGEGPHFWAAAFEFGDEFGGLGLPAPFPTEATQLRLKGNADNGSGLADKDASVPQNTTIAIVATDAALTKAQAHRLAVMAQTGVARAIYPVHTPLDGDVVFALATGKIAIADDPACLARLGALAANCLARAIARGVYHASALPGNDPPAWQERFGGVVARGREC